MFFYIKLFTKTKSNLKCKQNILKLIFQEFATEKAIASTNNVCDH